MRELGSSPQERDTRRDKVTRVIEGYDLSGLGDELVEFWTADGERRKSLRELETYFNVRVLEAALRRATHDVMEGEAENYYQLLTGDDVSEASSIDAAHRLDEMGVDADRLQSDFVSHQAIHTYLTKVRDVALADSSQNPEERLQAKLTTINRLKNRLVAVTDQSIQDLERSDVFGDSDARAVVRVHVECARCGELSPVRDYFANRGCVCDRDRLESSAE